MLFCKLLWQNTDAPPGKMSKCNKCLEFDHNLPFVVFAILQVVFPVSSTPSLFGIKEYWVLSLLTECKLQNPKQQKISEMADLLKIMRPKYLSFERKKKVKINLADLIEPNRTQTMRTCLVLIFFVALQNIWGTVGGFQYMIVQEVITVTLWNIFWGERLPAQAGHFLLQVQPAY